MHHLAKVAVLRQREEARHRLVDGLVAAVHRRVREHLLRAAAQLGERLRDGALAFLREKVATGEWRDDFQERVVSAYAY